jgi:hypothetical protein
VTELGEAATASVRIPPKLESTLERMQRNDLRVKAELTDDNGQFDRLAKQILYGLFFSAGIISGTLLYIFADAIAVMTIGVPTAVMGALLYRSFRKQRSLRAQPRFTRQRMRERDAETDVFGFGDVQTPASSETDQHTEMTETE